MFQKTYRLRMILLAVICMSAYGVIEARLYHLQIRQGPDFTATAKDQQSRVVVLKPLRGDILDCKGDPKKPLAKSYFCDTIVLDTRKVENPSPKLIRELARALGRSEDRIRALWDDPGNKYVYRKADEKLSRAVQMIAEKEKLEGFVTLERESKRDYPNGRLACHVIGFTKPDEGGDNIGQEGLEEVYNSYLSGSWSKMSVQANNRGKRLKPLDPEAIKATSGNTLVLTLNGEIQNAAEIELRKQVNALGAKSGTVIVMDVRTGGIVALANCPDFDLGDFARFAKEAPETLRNRALTDPYEIGSVMKIFTAAILLDKNLLSPNEMVNGMGGSVNIHGRRIPDVHPLGVIPYTKAFAESSNVVHALLSERLDPMIYHDALVRFGVGQPSGVDLPGEGRGRLRDVNDWTAQSRASLSIGYETSLTPLQVVSALQAIGNDGKRMRPHFMKEIRSPQGEVIKRFEPVMIERSVSAAVAAQLRELMQGVVEDAEGTGEAARIPGYSVGGKTGTTDKSGKRDGPKKYFAGFAGIVPLSNPRLAIYVCIDEPQGEKYGGTVSAPVFREVAINALQLLQIPKDKPDDPKIADAQATPAVLAETAGRAARPIVPMPVLPALDALGAIPTGPRMPNLQGMTIVQVKERLAKLGIGAKIRGSGVVATQEPVAGAPLPQSGEALVVFVHPSEAARTRLARAIVGAH